ncbi:MAG: hypothetical protein ACI92G_003422 [Candidatus Pelagisphaera sp.]
MTQTFHKSTEYWFVRIRFAEKVGWCRKGFLSEICPKVLKPAVASATPMSPLATLTFPSTSKLAQGYRKQTLSDVSICA